MKYVAYTEILLLWCVRVCFCGLENDTGMLKAANHNRNKRQMMQTGNMEYKTAWIEPCFITYSSTGTKPSEPCFELSVTSAVDDSVMNKTARLIQSMIRFVSRDIRDIMNEISFGVFSSKEYLTTAFPEYDVPLKCKFSCEGECLSLCYNGIARAISPSYPGPRVVVVDSNIDCNDNDPEGGNLNLLVKMFAESLYTNLFPQQLIKDLEQNYNAMRSEWVIEPDTPLAYWTEAVLTFFNARTSTGGMNTCADGKQCASEYENRKNIRERDTNLYTFLYRLFSYDRPYLLNDINTCEW